MSIGNLVKILGAVVAAAILLAGLNASNQLGNAAAVAAGILAATVAGLFYVCGIVVSAQGQILLATLDGAVFHSPFLSNVERLDAMGLPRTLAAAPPGRGPAQ